MRHFFILVSLVFLSQLALSQQMVKAYKDLESYRTNKYDTLNDVEIDLRSSGSIKMSGGNDYKVEANDKEVSNNLKKEYWGVEYNDTLLLNTKKIGSKWYALAIFRTPKHILFIAGVSRVPGAQQDNSGAMFGPIGGGINGAQQAMLRFDYLLDVQTGDIIVLKDNKRSGLNKVLSVNKELQQKYISAGAPTDDASYISYIKELDGIK